MPITEIVTLDLIAPYTHQSTPLVKLLQTLAHRQSAYSAYPVLFFTDTESPSRIYMISGWHDVEASSSWLQSADALEIVALLEPFRTVKSRIYVGIDFDTIPRGGVLCVRRQDARGTRLSRTRSCGGDKTSAFWEASGAELDAQPNGTATYELEVYTHDAWKATERAMDNSVSMQQFSLSRLYD